MNSHPPLYVQSANDGYSEFRLEQADFGIVATVTSQSDYGAQFAYLLAAAPDLLMACRDALWRLGELEGALNKDIDGTTQHVLSAAIAKATKGDSSHG